jgi:hypothetical protein
MTAILDSSHSGSSNRTGGDPIGAQIRALVGTRPSAHRRRSQRFAFPNLLKIVPVNPGTLMPKGRPIVVVGKHISEQGLGFFHQTPIPDRYVLVTVDRWQAPPLRLLMDLSWCRFTRHGWYESGGRFLRLVSNEIDDSSATGRADA